MSKFRFNMFQQKMIQQSLSKNLNPPQKKLAHAHVSRKQRKHHQLLVCLHMCFGHFSVLELKPWRA